MPWLTGTALLHSVMVQETPRNAEDLDRVARSSPPGSSRSWALSWSGPGILQSIHAFGASTLGVPVPGVHRRPLARLRAAGHLAGASELRSKGRALFAAVARSGVPAQQRRPRRTVLRDLLGHVLPADLRGADRAQGVPSARRGSTATRFPWRSCSCFSRGSDRQSPGGEPRPPSAARGSGSRPWRRRSPPRRCWRSPSTRSSGALGALPVRARSRSRSRRSVRRSGAAWRVRRALTHESAAGRRCSPWSAAIAGATAATWCTSGSRCSSSASPRRRPSSTSPNVSLRTGQSAVVGGYRRALRATDRDGHGPAGQPRGSRSTSARAAVASTRCRPSMGYYPIVDAGLGPVGSYLRRQRGERDRAERRGAPGHLDVGGARTSTRFSQRSPASTSGFRAPGARHSCCCCR